jgi:N-acetylneuraminate lyase
VPNRANRELRGVMPALVTAFDRRGKLNETAQREFIEFQIVQGIHGLFLCGGVGEGLLLTVEERKRLLEIAVDQAAGRVLIVDHIAAYQVADTLELARHAGESGADAICCLPPNWYYRPDLAGLVDYHRGIAAVCRLPLLVYNIPQRTGFKLTPDALTALRAVDTIAGAKDATTDLFNMRRLITTGGPGFAVFVGEDEVLLPGLLYGAVGGIGACYNVFPALAAGIYESARAGNWERARELQMRELEVAAAYDEYEIFGAIQETVRLMGFDCGVPRAPLRGLNDAEKTSFRRRIDALGFDPNLGFHVPGATFSAADTR